MTARARPAGADASRPVNLRALALVLLTRVEGGARLQPILSAACERGDLPATARAWLTELTQGTLRHADGLDVALERHLTLPAKRLPPPVRIILRLGAYQLAHMRTPDHAAVQETVALVGRRFGRLRGLVNAVLRKVAAAADASARAPAGHQTAPSAELLARTYSQPPWVVALLATQLGAKDLEAYLSACLERPPLWVRVNEHKIGRDALLQQWLAAGLSPTTLPALPAGLRLESAGQVAQLPGFEAGHFAVQDGAAQAVGQLLAPPRGARVLDACAAPGGKTLQLLAAVGREGQVVAVDRHAARLARIAPEAARLGLSGRLDCFALDLCDSAARAALGAPFDFILLDAPCSGMGTLRRHGELRQRTEASMASLLTLQRELLAAAYGMLAPGGTLVYAVCSPLAIEGADQAARLLAQRGDLSQARLPEGLAAFAGGTKHCLATWPHIHGLDAFYATRLERRAAG